MNKIALTNYLLKVNIYKQKELDFFSFLVLQIADNIKDDKLLIDELRECYIPESLDYLFEDAFYYLLDNHLISSDTDDFDNVHVGQFTLTDSGRLAIEKSFSLEKVDSREINISINPLTDKLIAYKDPSKFKEYELIEKSYTKEEINSFLNARKVEIFNDKTSDFYYDCEILHVLPTSIS